MFDGPLILWVNVLVADIIIPQTNIFVKGDSKLIKKGQRGFIHKLGKSRFGDTPWGLIMRHNCVKRGKTCTQCQARENPPLPLIGRKNNVSSDWLQLIGGNRLSL